MSLREYIKNELWPILVETVHASVMYPTHKAYTREEIISKKPDLTASELANRLNIPFGEAIVILHELIEERSNPSQNI